MAKVRATITIDEELFKELTDTSKEQSRSFSSQVIFLVKKGKEKTEKVEECRTEFLKKQSAPAKI